MRNNNNPGRAIDFANIKSGDIIIADTFTTEDTLCTVKVTPGRWLATS